MKSKLGREEDVQQNQHGVLLLELGKSLGHSWGFHDNDRYYVLLS